MNNITGENIDCCQEDNPDFTNIESDNINNSNTITTQELKVNNNINSNHINTESITVNQYANVVHTLEVDEQCIVKNAGFLYKDVGNVAHKNHHINYGTNAYMFYSFNPIFNMVGFLNNGNLRTIRVEQLIVGARFKLSFSLKISDVNNPTNNTTAFGVRFNNALSSYQFIAPSPNLFIQQLIRGEIDIQINTSTTAILSGKYIYFQADGNHKYPQLYFEILNFGTLVGNDITIEPYYRILTGSNANVTFARYDLSLFQYA